MSTTTKEEYVIINKNDMVAIADVVRPLIGTSDTMNIGSLKTNLNSVKENIDKTFAALEEKGVSIPANGNVGDIAGLIGDMSSGGNTGETWVMKEEVNCDTALSDDPIEISFTSGGQTFPRIYIGDGEIMYVGDRANVEAYYEKWLSESFRKITFASTPNDVLLTWLEANATKQASDTAIQGSKPATISSNGTISVTPDAPYDAIGKVNLTVKVMEDLMKFFGGSKYYVTSVTPTGGYITSIPITVTDASILSSLKFLLVVSDISASTQSLNDEIAVYAPSIDGYIGVRMALSIGKISTLITSAYNAYSYDNYAGETYCDASGGDVWSQYGISISGNKITIGTKSNSYFYKPLQQYKVLLIG